MSRASLGLQAQARRSRKAPCCAILHGVCWFSAETAEFCEQQGVLALVYAEQVKDHWYPGACAALAVMPRAVVDKSLRAD